jgi:signal peptidase II
LKKAALIIFTVLFLDQALKVWVKLHMSIGEEIPVLGNWFNLYFTENNGMAFGLEFGGEWGKLSLSIFRIIAVTAIFVYLIIISKHNAKGGLIFAVSMIFAGALGNIIDSVLYGLVFTSSSYHTIAEVTTLGKGYAGFLHGKVVDMLYFPIINIQSTDAPSWIPSFLFGYDDHFVFFRPIFNIADSAITIGVSWLLLFERKNLNL